MGDRRFKISAARWAFAAIIVAGIAAAAIVVKQDKPEKKQRRSGREALEARIVRLPQAGAGWMLAESGKLAGAIRKLTEGAGESLAAETARVAASDVWGGDALRRLAANRQTVALVADGRSPQDTAYIGRLREAGAAVTTPVIASSGGKPDAGAIRANFLVADARRGYIGGAPLAPRALAGGIAPGLIFDNAVLASSLLAWIDADAGWPARHPIDRPRDAMLLQTGPEQMLLPGVESARDATLALINRAATSIDAMMGEMDNRSGAYNDYVAALTQAARRGVAVRVITGRNARPAARALAAGGVTVRAADDDHAGALYVDGEWLIVGSHAWTYDADFEDRRASVLLRSTRLAAQFKKLFESVWPGADLV